MHHNLNLLISNLKNHLNIGQLYLILPDQKMRYFMGKIKGPSVTLVIYNWDFVDNLIKEGPNALVCGYAKEQWSASNLIDFMLICFKNKSLFEFSSKTRSSLFDWVLKQISIHKKSYDFVFDQFIDHCCTEKMGQIQKLLVAQQKMKILDVGCDGGNFAKIAVQQKHDVTILTLSKFNYEKVKKTFSEFSDIINLRLLYKANPKGMYGTYDLITAMGLFENLRLTNLQNILVTIKNNLVETGSAFLQTFCVFSEDSHYLEKYLFNENTAPKINELKREAAKQGLEIVSIKTTENIQITHLEKMYDMIKESAFSEQPLDLLKSVEYCCATIIAALKTETAGIFQIQIKHAIYKNNVIQLAI